MPTASRDAKYEMKKARRYDALSKLVDDRLRESYELKLESILISLSLGSIILSFRQDRHLS